MDYCNIDYNMEISKFINTINAHCKGIYESSITEMEENNKTMNWLLGLASGALIFSFNKYESIGEENLTVVLIQALVFVLIIITGFLYRYTSSKFKSSSISIIKMFDFLKIGLELIPDLIEKEAKVEKLDTVFSNYLNGEYFLEGDQEIFFNIVEQRTKYRKQVLFLSILAALLMIIEFGCFFAIVFIQNSKL